MYDWLEIFGGVALGLIIGYFLWKRGQDGLTVGEVTQTLQESIPLAMEVKQVAEMAALAAEEYQRKGTLTTGEDQLKFAMNVFRRWIPLARGVDDVAMLEAIHAAVPIARSLGLNVEVTKEPLITTSYIDPQTGERKIVP